MTALNAGIHDDLQRCLESLAGLLVPGATGVARLRRLSGGAVQETFAFDVVREGSPVTLVLRRARKSLRRDRTHGVTLAQEAAAIRLAGLGGVPVAAVVRALDGSEGVGEGFISSFIPGETIPRRILLDPALAPARDRFSSDCGTTLAKLHALPAATFPFLDTIMPEEALARMEADYRAFDRPGPVFEAALRWLAHHVPSPPTRPCVVHADFRLGNLIIDPSGIAAVIDWEGVHLGDPAADLAYLTIRPWRFGQMHKAVGGIGARRELIPAYVAAGGVAPAAARLHFWEVALTFWWGLVCASMARQFTSGQDYAVERGAVGRRRSEAELELVCLLSREIAA